MNQNLMEVLGLLSENSFPTTPFRKAVCTGRREQEPSLRCANLSRIQIVN